MHQATLDPITVLDAQQSAYLQMMVDLLGSLFDRIDNDCYPVPDLESRSYSSIHDVGYFLLRVASFRGQVMQVRREDRIHFAVEQLCSAEGWVQVDPARAAEYRAHAVALLVYRDKEAS